MGDTTNRLLAKIQGLNLRDGDTAIVQDETSVHIDDRVILTYLSELNQNVEVLVVVPPLNGRDFKIPRDLVRRLNWRRSTIPVDAVRGAPLTEFGSSV